jgi:hypothetical protein
MEIAKAGSIWRNIKRGTELLTFVSIIFGMGYNTFQFRKSLQEERTRHIASTYDVLDQAYVEFEKLCMQYPRLDCNDNSSPNPPELNESEIIQQELLYNIWLSMLERAFKASKTEGFDDSDGEWEGWVKYVDEFVSRKVFQVFWPKNRKDYNAEFGSFIDSRIKSLPVTLVP